MSFFIPTDVRDTTKCRHPKREIMSKAMVKVKANSLHLFAQIKLAAIQWYRYKCKTTTTEPCPRENTKIAQIFLKR